jgi:chemotaxis protein methyltransferase CheR
MTHTAVIDAVPTPTERELSRIITFVRDRSGICLHDGKRALIVARLQKRMRAGGFNSFGEYLELVESDTSGEELTLLLDAIATNHTSFFREPQHFEFLVRRVLPELIARPGRPSILGWCAACSTGEEPYTILMSLLEAMPDADRSRLQLLASDLSTKALNKAQAATYPLERLAGVSPELLRRYFEKGLGAQSGLARLNAEVRKFVQYRRLNLIHFDDLGTRFDFIFCRNVMIYFDRDVQQRVVQALEAHLAPRGFLFIAHAESLNGVRHGLTWVAPAIYQRKDG